MKSHALPILPRKNRRRRLFAAAIFSTLAAGCGDVGEGLPGATGPGATTTLSGWRVDPQGDLNAFFDCLDDNGAALVSAHRGGPYPGFPENALETIAEILKQAPALIEIDVATSSDGVLFLMHDDTLERTTTGSGEARAMTWAEISKLRLKDNDGARTAFHPPAFADVLAFTKDRTILQIDFKRSTRFEDVVNEVKRQGAGDRVIYIAYGFAAARKLHRLHPEAMISLSLDAGSELNRAVAAGIPADRLIGFTGTEDVRPRLFSILSDRDVEVIFGTLGGSRSIDREIARTGDNARYATIAGQGVDIIATDRPAAAHKALARAGRAPAAGQCGIEGA